MSNEQLIWKGSPSQLRNLFIFTSSIFIITIPFAIYHWLKTKNEIFELSPERINNRTGILSKSLDSVELYRVRDYKLHQPFFLRLFKLGNITLHTTDKTNSTLYIPAIREPEALLEIIRKQAEICKETKKVREIDVA